MTNDELFRFVNSRDIREHLQGLGFQFTNLQAAWLVWQARALPLEDRWAAWEEICRDMPDEDLGPGRTWDTDGRFRTVREWLPARIAYERRLFTELSAPGKAVVYALRWHDHSDSEEGLFATFEEAIERARQVAPGWEEEPERLHAPFRIERWHLGSSKREGCVLLDRELRPVSVWAEDESERPGYVDQVLDHCWFDFPTPFKEGDIVIDCTEEHRGKVPLWSGPFVLLETDPERRKRQAERRKKEGKRPWRNPREWAYSMDMTASGYFLDDTGALYSEVMHAYMNLERYRGELAGPRRALLAASAKVRGEVPLDTFGYAYAKVLVEGLIERARPAFISDCELELCGIQPSGKEQP